MAKHRHKRDANARRIPRAVIVAAPISVLATLSAVTFGVVSQDTNPSTRDLLAGSSVSSDLGAIASERSGAVSRSRSRLDVAAEKRADKAAKAAQARKAQAKVDAQAKSDARAEAKAATRAVAQADTRLWTTEALNLWTSADASADKVDVVDAGERVLVTGREAQGRVEIVIGGSSRWVTAGYLDAEKPVVGIAGIGGTCTNGSSVASGVDPNIVKVHQAVCARFPQITSYGTFRSDGEHGQGRAVDVMISGSTGWDVANYLRENYAALGIEYLIYSQNIWSVDRAGEGWRSMSDRGSTTANHYDHVHVTVY